jgi:hypothetical protein
MSIAGQITEEVFTPELIKGNQPLASLTDEQINAFVTLGNNAVKTRIGEHTNKIYTGIDQDIENETGLKKEEGERTYAFVKRALKVGNKELSGYLSELKEAKKTLEAQVKSGDVTGATKKQIEELESKIKDKESEVSLWKTKYDTDLTAKETAIKEATEKNMKIRIDHNMAEALTGFKFIEEAKLPKVARDATVGAAKSAVLSEYKPDFITDGNGNERLVWKNAQGEIARNPENKLEPFTTAELLSKHIDPILDKGRQQTGAGTQPPASGKSSFTGQYTLDGARTQVEATTKLVDQLIANGVPQRTKEFDKQLTDLFTELQADKLPFK